MINGKRVIAIIPARGGSKRLPQKNILPLGGKPLISWTIDAAKKSDYIDSVYISTDSHEIQSIALNSYVDCPQLRPKELASDTASTESVILHVLDSLDEHYDIVILLQPTSPLRGTSHINEALSLFDIKNAYSIISVTSCEHSPLWANVLPDDNSMSDFLTGSVNKRSQDLKPYYRLNGAIYIFDVKYLLKSKGINYSINSFAYKMNNESSVDIDQRYDFILAESILKSIK